MNSDADLRHLVATMRELGVVEAWGVKLGPEPPRTAVLERKLAAVPEDAATAAELREARRLERLHTRRDEVRAKLGDFAMSDEACDRYLNLEGDG